MHSNLTHIPPLQVLWYSIYSAPHRLDTFVTPFPMTSQHTFEFIWLLFTHTCLLIQPITTQYLRTLALTYNCDVISQFYLMLPSLGLFWFSDLNCLISWILYFVLYLHCIVCWFKLKLVCFQFTSLPLDLDLSAYVCLINRFTAFASCSRLFITHLMVYNQ